MHKQLDVGFIWVVHYPQWVANSGLVLKKDGRVRIFVYFGDLNKASPKDDLPLRHTDILVDNTASYAHLSSMKGYVIYNQVKMVVEDMKKTTFITL